MYCIDILSLIDTVPFKDKMHKNRFIVKYKNEKSDTFSCGSQSLSLHFLDWFSEHPPYLIALLSFSVAIGFMPKPLFPNFLSNLACH